MSIEPLPLPSAEYLAECFIYDPGTGVFTWRERPPSHFRGPRAGREHKRWNKRFSGTRAGGIRTGGYRSINLDGKLRKASRLAWKMHTGADPPGEVDHRNTIADDDRWDNLRIATRSQQNANQHTRVTNRPGLKGVYPHGKKFGSRIMCDGKIRNLGVFVSAEEAHAAYCDAATERYGEFHNPGR